MNINTNPSDQSLEEIRNWFTKYKRKFTFSSNLNVIENAFKRNNLITLEHKNITIAYISFRTDKTDFYIDIMEVMPLYRSKGHGAIFYKLTEEYFKAKNFKFIKLDAQPETSRPFWIKMGYVETYPGTDNFCKEL